MKRRLLQIAAVLLGFALVFPFGFAFGDAGRYSGSRDYSSGGSVSGGSYDGGGYSGGGYSGGSGFVFLSTDGDEGYGDEDEFDEEAEGDDAGDLLFVLLSVVILGIVLYAAYQLLSSRKSASAPVRIQDTFDLSRVVPLAGLVQRDPGFSEEDIREKVSNWYVRLQHAWTDGDLSPVRPFFSDALFAQFESQLEELTSQGLVNRVDNIAVLGVSVDGWYEEAGEEKLVAMVSARICDYIVDAEGNVVDGDRFAEKFMTYRYILARTAGTQTGGEAETRAVNCPNCAAVLNINKTAVCPYCDSVVTVEEHGWVISAIQGLEQRTA